LTKDFEQLLLLSRIILNSMASNNMILSFEEWIITSGKNIQLLHKNICIAKNITEFLNLRNIVNAHIRRQALLGNDRCISILNPHTFDMVLLHRSQKEEFIKFLFAAEREFAFLQELADQCKLDKCPHCECTPEWYFTLN